MQKSFFRNLLFLLYLEFVFHIACFKGITISNGIILLFTTIIFAGLFSIMTSLSKNEKLNKNIVRVFCGVIAILFSAELVYYQIYESFFNISGVQFVGALKDGYDKVLLTIFQNIIPIGLMITPTIFYIIKMPKIQKINKLSFGFITAILVICTAYFSVFVLFVNKEDPNSLYSLFFQKNLPIQNVKKIGLLGSTSLSVERKLFGFKPVFAKSEDIYSNTQSALLGSLDTKYNIDESIDFDKLAKEETNPTIQNLHNYFKYREATEQNEYTGIFKDKNVILIMAESFDEIAIDKELTPTLYKMKTEGIVFNNYFAPKYPASTADGEYMLEWGTLPIIGENYSLIDMVYNTNPYILPRALKNENYKTYVYHDYFGYYNRRKSYFGTLDFDGHRYCEEGISTRCEFFHGSDMDMMDQSIDDFISQDKFFTYYLTLSGHGSYDASNFVAGKHIHKVQHLPYSYQVKYYLAANIDFDLAMNILITRLEQAGKLDDTVIIISSDHSPYYLSNYEVNSISKIDRDNKFDRNRGSLIIYNSGYHASREINKYAMNIDVLPTVLNMLGIPYDSRLIIGKDIMAKNNDGLVIFPDRSWVNENGSYDSTTGAFNPYKVNVDNKYIEKTTNDANDRYNISVSMQYNDYYSYIFK